MNLNVDNIVEQCYKALPNEIKRHPWSILNHGYDVLDSDEKLDAYIASYGEMHIKKCKKALQNFPFDDFCQRDSHGELIHVEDFEIFDWGCGQGIGTLTMLQYLSERNMLHGIIRINLIEPSVNALHRAQAWVRQSTYPNTEIRAYNRLIPSNDSPLWNDIDCAYTKAIHIFSNILGIQEVGLHWIAKQITKLSPNVYCVCVGPKYGRGISRISDFHNYMGAPACFSDFSTYPFDYTSTTNHPYGIEVKGFKFTNSASINDSYCEQSHQQQVDELEVLGDETLQSVIEAYQILKHEASNLFDVFLRPNLGIERPDILLCNISRGIVIINVCDNISDFNFAYNRVDSIRQALIDTYIKSLKIDTVINSSVYNCIKIGLFFTNATQAQVEEACNEYYEHKKQENEEKGQSQNYNPQDPTIYLLKFFKTKCKETLPSSNANGFKFDYYQEIKDLMLSKWHPATDGNHQMKLTPRQQEILNIDSKRLRVKGVAGCGKTHLLAYKSVKENLRTGSKVLIVTFNITLIQYILMRISEVPADFSFGDFDIINYHQFFKSKAKRYHNGYINLDSYDQTSFFKPYKDDIIKNGDQYKTIIIDEAQDFKTVWIDILREYFLTEDGSMTLFGDGEQNIYEREQEPEVKMPRVNGFGGKENPWKKMSERISMRMLNPQISDLASKFAKEFKLSTQPIQSAPSLNLFDYKMGYWHINSDTDATTLTKNIMWIINTYELDKKDIVVLSPNIGILREIDKEHRNAYKTKTIRTFESEEEFIETNRILQSKASLLLDLKAIRRVAKVHFTTHSQLLKFATIQSFKGWESKTIILILQDSTISKQTDNDVEEAADNLSPDPALTNASACTDNQPRTADTARNDKPALTATPALIYTAITRARENLFILNCGNITYHSFFQNNITNG